MAAIPRAQQTEDPTVLDAAAGLAMFDRQARRLLGMSGDEFLSRLDAGAYRDEEDSPEGRAAMYLAVLAPFGRRDP